MKRIAYVINFIVNGGPSAVVLNMIHNLDRTKYEPVLITLFQGNSSEIIDREKKNGLQIIECGYQGRLQFLLFGLAQYKKILTENNIDIVHGHGFVPDIMNARLDNNIRTINTVHNIMFEDYLFNYGAVKGRIYCWAHLWAMKRLDMVVCCSKSVYDVMKKYIPDCQYTENGIEDLTFEQHITRKSLGIPEDAIVFLYAGGLINRKRVPFLIKNFVKYHGEKEYLIILGNGEEEALSKQSSDNHVIFAGFQSNPYQYMAISNIYTSASSSEGFSISVLEALHCGLGLFLSDIPSHKEVIDGIGKMYVGEHFSDRDFEIKFRNIISNIHDINPVSIKEYQRKNLSAESMIKKYQIQYDKL